MHRLVIAIVLVAPLALSTSARADGPVFHRTTPRATLLDTAGLLLIGVPSGRAWGVESELRPLPAVDAAVGARITVDDPAVREAFLRVAYYASGTGRTRQLAVVDSHSVPYGSTALVAVLLDPPPSAVAYRVRVLARLDAAVAVSRGDALRVALNDPHADASPFMPSRLLP